jgi:hypothetical protein
LIYYPLFRFEKVSSILKSKNKSTPKINMDRKPLIFLCTCVGTIEKFSGAETMGEKIHCFVPIFVVFIVLVFIVKFHNMYRVNIKK